MTKVNKVKDLIYCLVIIVIAMIFILFPIKSILLETFSRFLGWPQITQGMMEIVIVYSVGMIIIIGVSNKTLKCFLLIILSFLYLQNHQFLIPYLVATVYIELIICIGTAVRKICKFKIENNYVDYLASFTFGIATWGVATIVFSLLGKGTFTWLRIITLGLFSIAFVICRRKPISIYFVENCKSKKNSELLLIYFLSILILIQGAKSCKAFDYDSLWYGLHPENVLIGKNSFYDNLGMLAWVHYFPKFFELFAAPLSDFGEYSFIHAVNIWFYIFLILIVYKFFAELKLSNVKALFYTITIATIPVIANYSTVAKPDIFSSFFTVLSAFCFFKAISENNFNYLSLAYAGIMLSLCGKISSYPYIAILFFSGTITYIVVHKKNVMKEVFRKENAPCFVLLGFSLVVLLGTFYRTYLLTGYPLYPFTVNIWKKIGFTGVYPFADYFGGRNAGFAEGTVFNLRFYLKHIINLLFTPNKIGEYRRQNIVINWYSNFGIFLSVVLIINILKKVINYKGKVTEKSVGIISALLLPVWLGMILISVFLFQFAHDGNYYIIPVVLGIVYLLFMHECVVDKYNRLYCGIFIAFVILQFLIMFVSHWSWHLGTSEMKFSLFKSSFDSHDNDKYVLENNDLYAIEEYIAGQSYTNSRALGHGNDVALFRLSTGYEHMAYVVSMTKGICDSEENLLKYLDWANVNFLILPNENSGYTFNSEEYQTFQNVCMYFQELDDVFVLETDSYTLLDITAYTDLSNIRKVVD